MYTTDIKFCSDTCGLSYWLSGHSGLAGFCLYASAEGADSERGRLLYENHCLACLETLAYMREAHKVRSLSDLRVRVIRWAQNQKLGWGKDEVNDVVNYLDSQYYHYGPTSD